jgi:glutamate dehydrogenase
LANVLEHYPRDELFQVEEDSLYHFSLAILQLDERPRVRVLARRDRFDRFVSVLVFVPRERYDSDIRARIGDYLASAFIGRVSAFYPFFPEGPLVRVHFIIGRSGGHVPAIDSATLEREVAAIVRSWTDGLSDALALVNPPDKVRALFRRYREAFSVGFQEAYAPAVAAGDITALRKNSARSASKSGVGSARCRCRNAFRCWKTWVSGWWTSAPTTSSPRANRRANRRAKTSTTPGSTTCCWSAATAA